MTTRLVADAVVVAHFAFIAFVTVGFLAVLREPRLAWLHVPAVAWAAYVTLTGAICPLTPLELDLRRAAGQGGYRGGFIEHYLVPLIYPPGLTRPVQAALGVAVLVVNVAAYAWLVRRRATRRS